ncbi:unnamed protein product [Mytilus coruscus]|uniref:IRG-type G domain-containing protein n=1 Tax=Mytilus coruscus TaxID=42192 RepID=A0A6J8C8Z7_MYTCO|nr:unnamed protein product [Mytilus coruscus]
MDGLWEEKEDVDAFCNWTPDEDVKHIHQEITEFIAKKGVQFLFDFIEKKSNEWKDAKIQIGILGESGSGKSSFLNTIRGLKRGDEGFADQGYKGNTTSKSTKYTIKDNPNIIFTDGVGCGTIQYKRDSEYLKSLEIEKLDFVLLMSNRNFSQDDAWFAKEICKMGKPLFFVRTKFDEILRSAKVDGISGDFDQLMAAILKTLSQKKRAALLYSIPPLSHKVIKEKKEELIRRVYVVSILSAAAAAVPIPGVDVCVDFSVLYFEIQFYLKEFSLTEDKIESTCKRLKMNYQELLSKLPRVRNFLVTGIKAIIIASIKSELAEKTTEVMAN